MRFFATAANGSKKWDMRRVCLIGDILCDRSQDSISNLKAIYEARLNSQ